MTDATAKRNKSTARRSRRDRRHYLLGYVAGRVAGLKEAVALADAEFARAQKFLSDNRGVTIGDRETPISVLAAQGKSIAALSVATAIRARIAEIEGEAG